MEQKAISQKEYDDATSALKTSDASVVANEAMVREADLNVSYTRVTSPIADVSGRALQSVGSLVTAGSESSLLTTVNITDPIWVSFSFSESEVLQLRCADGKAGVTLLLPDGTYARPGKLNFAGSSVDNKTGTVPLRAAFPNPKLELLPGQFVRVQITLEERNAYLVPQSALSQGDQGKAVFTVSADNTVAPRPVEIQAFFTFERAERTVIDVRRSHSFRLGLALHIGFLRVSRRLLSTFRVVPPTLWHHLDNELGLDSPKPILTGIFRIYLLYILTRFRLMVTAPHKYHRLIQLLKYRLM